MKQSSVQTGRWRSTRGEKVHKKNSSWGIWSALIYFLRKKRGLIASGSATTAGKLNKRCHIVALLCRFMSAKAWERCTQLGVAPARPGSASQRAVRSCPLKCSYIIPFYQLSCRITAPNLDGGKAERRCACVCVRMCLKHDRNEQIHSRLHSTRLKMQILMGFILKVCISSSASAAVTDIFRLIKCHQLPMVTVNNSMKTR